MKNCLLLAATVACLAASAPAEPSSPSAPPPASPRQPKPNLIFVLADQLRYQSCGFAGDAQARTPNLDSLARQGVHKCELTASGAPVD